MKKTLALFLSLVLLITALPEAVFGLPRQFSEKFSAQSKIFDKLGESEVQATNQWMISVDNGEQTAITGSTDIEYTGSAMEISIVNTDGQELRLAELKPAEAFYENWNNDEITVSLENSYIKVAIAENVAIPQESRFIVVFTARGDETNPTPDEIFFFIHQPGQDGPSSDENIPSGEPISNMTAVTVSEQDEKDNAYLYSNIGKSAVLFEEDGLTYVLAPANYNNETWVAISEAGGHVGKINNEIFAPGIFAIQGNSLTPVTTEPALSNILSKYDFDFRFIPSMDERNQNKYPDYYPALYRLNDNSNPWNNNAVIAHYILPECSGEFFVQAIAYEKGSETVVAKSHGRFGMYMSVSNSYDLSQAEYKNVSKLNNELKGIAAAVNDSQQKNYNDTLDIHVILPDTLQGTITLPEINVRNVFFMGRDGNRLTIRGSIENDSSRQQRAMGRNTKLHIQNAEIIGTGKDNSSNIAFYGFGQIVPHDCYIHDFYAVFNGSDNTCWGANNTEFEGNHIVYFINYKQGAGSGDHDLTNCKFKDNDIAMWFENFKIGNLAGFTCSGSSFINNKVDIVNRSGEMFWFNNTLFYHGNVEGKLTLKDSYEQHPNNYLPIIYGQFSNGSPTTVFSRLSKGLNSSETFIPTANADGQVIAAYFAPWPDAPNHASNNQDISSVTNKNWSFLTDPTGAIPVSLYVNGDTSVYENELAGFEATVIDQSGNEKGKWKNNNGQPQHDAVDNNGSLMLAKAVPRLSANPQPKAFKPDFTIGLDLGQKTITIPQQSIDLSKQNLELTIDWDYKDFTIRNGSKTIEGILKNGKLTFPVKSSGVYTITSPSGQADTQDFIKKALPVVAGAAAVGIAVGVGVAATSAVTKAVKTAKDKVVAEAVDPKYEPEKETFKFTDVNEDLEDAVLWAIDNNITSGMTSTEFGPSLPCTRAQVMTFLWRAAGCPVVNGINIFTDIKTDDYFMDAVTWAREQGITTGTSEDLFSPDDPCSRAQIISFIWRFAGSIKPVSSESQFTDVLDKDYYKDAVLWANEHSIASPLYAESFGAEETCTRGEAVSFLYNLLGK